MQNMDLKWINDRWEDLSYYKLHLSNSHDRLKQEYLFEDEEERYKSRKVKISRGNYKSKRWIYNSEFGALEEIFKL